MNAFLIIVGAVGLVIIPYAVNLLPGLPPKWKRWQVGVSLALILLALPFVMFADIVQMDGAADNSSPPSISLPRPSGESFLGTSHYCVNPVEGGAHSGLVALAGQVVTLEDLGIATNAVQGGESNNCGGSFPVDFDGTGNTGAASGTKFDKNAVLPSAPVGCVIVRIGDGPWFALEKKITLRVERDGWVLFAYNDSPTEHTTDSTWVRIHITQG